MSTKDKLLASLLLGMSLACILINTSMFIVSLLGSAHEERSDMIPMYAWAVGMVLSCWIAGMVAIQIYSDMISGAWNQEFELEEEEDE